jgi:hypothetical protein
MNTKIFATAVIMLCATGCATTAARRQFDDINLPAGLAYQPQDSVVIESPNVKAAQLVYRGRLEPVTLGDAMRTRLEASGWRPVSRITTSKDGIRQVFEKDGNALEVHIYHGRGRVEGRGSREGIGGSGSRVGAREARAREE